MLLCFLVCVYIKPFIFSIGLSNSLLDFQIRVNSKTRLLCWVSDRTPTHTHTHTRAPFRRLLGVTFQRDGNKRA